MECKQFKLLIDGQTQPGHLLTLFLWNYLHLYEAVRLLFWTGLFPLRRQRCFELRSLHVCWIRFVYREPRWKQVFLWSAFVNNSRGFLCQKIWRLNNRISPCGFLVLTFKACYGAFCESETTGELANDEFIISKFGMKKETLCMRSIKWCVRYVWSYILTLLIFALYS